MFIHLDYAGNRNHRMTTQITNAVATSMAVSPLWLDGLQQISNIAAIMTPILGCVWLGIQIFYKIREGVRIIQEKRELKE